LLVLPAVFNVAQRKASTASASLDPDDPANVASVLNEQQAAYLEGEFAELPAEEMKR